jgi:hypothetical protein
MALQESRTVKHTSKHFEILFNDLRFSINNEANITIKKIPSGLQEKQAEQKKQSIILFIIQIKY